MLIYGDPQYRISSKRFLSNFSERLNQARAERLDDIRALLIQAGQFEQGMADAGHDICELTDLAAGVFYNVWKQRPADLTPLRKPEEGPDLTLTIKIPEGYEFYALHPEQYMASAEALASERAPQRALVIGIRSIGTSLSAAVSAALQARGWTTTRHTVRPEGHPYDREASLPRHDANNFDLAIIVDEGPGLSGSSVSAVARNLHRAGFARIVIFPGHQNGPGPAANESTRTLWAQAEKRFTPAQPVPFRDLSAGKWRELLKGDWPPAFIPFERAKYLSPDGVLWKFAGLGAAYDNGKTGPELARQRMETIAAEGLGPPPLESRGGFVAMPWIEGTRLSRADGRDPAIMDLLSQYVIRCAGLPLDPDEMRSGQDRLAEMALANIREGLGGKWAQVAQIKLDRGRDLHMFQSYGDGRLAPVEWVRQPDGRILKVDSFGHDADHTLIGRQSIVWDIAGLILEWEIPAAQTRTFLQSLARQGACLTTEVLDFFQIAYAAFRMGLCNFCGAQTTDEGEKARLSAAERSYGHKLLQILSRE